MRSETFFRLFVYLATGGFLALALVPGKQVSRGFFRFSAGLYAALFAVACAIEPEWIPVLAVPALLGAAQALLAPARLAMALAAAIGIGFALFDASCWSLAAALTWRRGEPLAALIPAAYATPLLSALLLGSTMTAMILGHWYLVMPRLPPDPLLRLARLFGGSVVLRVAAVLGVIWVTYLWGDWDRFIDDAGILIWPRLLFGLLGPLVLAAMVLPTVRASDTQPATGMLYVACVLVLVGEGIALYLGLTTQVPV